MLAFKFDNEDILRLWRTFLLLWRRIVQFFFFPQPQFYYLAMHPNKFIGRNYGFSREITVNLITYTYLLKVAKVCEAGESWGLRY
ncbi:hypothetical protein CAL7102_00012 [Dulcicalothrix desertica PCC 7102]|nr:hypothetical protein CAL7102_00012 [Dulcicalothrix desertica PCC 7102]